MYINSKELCNLNSIKDVLISRNLIIDFTKVEVNPLEAPQKGCF